MDQSSPTEIKTYKAHLTRCGPLINETLTLLEEYNKLKDWDDLKEKVIDENILNKKSSSTINTFLLCIKNRFFNVEELPNIETIAQFVSNDIPEKAKIQLLWPYICRTDSLIEQYVFRLLEPNINSLSMLDLSKDTFYDFFEEESQSHPELQKWSEGSKKKWVLTLLSIFRSFDFMIAGKNIKLNKPSLRIETFTFYCLWLLLSGKAGIEVIKSEIWKYFILSESEIESLLEDSQRKGWIIYTRSGDMISVKTEFSSMEEWINGLK